MNDVVYSVLCLNYVKNDNRGNNIINDRVFINPKQWQCIYEESVFYFMFFLSCVRIFEFNYD